MATLYIVTAPFNNLEDISMRALRILNGVDFILCEDIGATEKLLGRYNIKTPTISYNENFDLKKIDYILKLLKQGRKLAFVSGAGIPAPSEIGGKIAQAAIDKFSDGVSIEFVPGLSAVTAALSMSGIPTDKFIFMGFPPHKRGRQMFIKKILESEWPVVVYESKHRIIKFLEELEKAFKEISLPLAKGENKRGWHGAIPPHPTPLLSKERETVETRRGASLQSVVICRELSKMHETVYRGDINSVIKKIKNNKDEQKGEFVLIIGK